MTKSISAYVETYTLFRVIVKHWAILDLKMACPHNFGPTLMIFLKFCAMEGAKSSWKLY